MLPPLRSRNCVYHRTPRRSMFMESRSTCFDKAAPQILSRNYVRYRTYSRSERSHIPPMGKTESDLDDDRLEECRKLLDQMDTLLQRIRNHIRAPRKPEPSPKLSLVAPRDEKKT